ncbi:MAG: valine--tRNA ligase, partial [Saprospiraceae bacterium]
YPKPASFDQDVIDKVEQAKDIITNIRDIRNKNGIKMKDQLEVFIMNTSRSVALMEMKGWSEICTKLGNLSNIALTDKDDIEGLGFISGTEKCIVAIGKALDVEAELSDKKKELEYQHGFVSSVQAKLSNERFVSGAPAAVVDKEKSKLADGIARIKILEEDITRLEAMI